MLTELHIENIAVIERADIAFGKGFNVLTGETGAGKSIIIDSLGAVLGARTNHELVRSGAEKGVVTAVFDTNAADGWLRENDIDPEGEVILQRKISADGKNSCRVCGCPVTVTQLKQIGGLLLDIHGQNDGRQLMDEQRHREYLDGFGEMEPALQKYSEEYEKYRALIAEQKSLNMDQSEKERLSELLRYEIDELQNADIRPGEEDEKTARRDLLHNAEKITELIDMAYDELYSGEYNASSLASDGAALLSRAMTMGDELKPAYESLLAANDLITDAIERIRDFRESLDYSPAEYNELESRLAFLRRLERKYATDETGLIDRLERSKTRLDEIEYAEDRLLALEKAIAAQSEVCTASAKELSSLRKIAAEKLQKKITDELSDLSMPSVRFLVDFSPVSDRAGFGRYGCDEISFLMSANPGEPLGKISRIASGGELSRIMLAMKNAFAEKDAVPTLVFDEIDTGVSGVAAQRVGEKIASLSSSKQVLCVTHLPQIAAMADEHLVIKKSEKNGRTFTSVSALDEDGRKMELARLHGGENITVTTLASAGEQLAAANKYKRSMKK